jgi:hypothetical protein
VSKAIICAAPGLASNRLSHWDEFHGLAAINSESPFVRLQICAQLNWVQNGLMVVGDINMPKD